MSSIDRLPIAFRCPACGKVIRTTRGFLLKEPLACPQCHGEVPRGKIEQQVDRSMRDFVKTVIDLERGAA